MSLAATRPLHRPPFPGSPDYPFKKPVVNSHPPHGPVQIRNKSIFIQIDGLSHAAFKMAEKMDLIPATVRDYFVKHRYRIEPFYCGQESATPASTAGFLYGAGEGFPSFTFRDPITGNVVSVGDRGVNPGQYLGRREPGLLEQGSIYTMLFDGDSDCGSFVKSQASLFPGGTRARLWEMFRPDLFTRTLLRAGGCLIGNLKDEISKRPSGAKEWKGAVCNAIRQAGLGVLIGELSCRGVRSDIAQGVPVIWVNFAGYDSQAHFFGPFTRQAFSALREIFSMIEEVVATMEKMKENSYDLYLLSDHGQVPSDTFHHLFGETLIEFVARTLGKSGIHLAASGPHAHLYFPENGGRGDRLAIGEKSACAHKLLKHPGIGLVAFSAGASTVIAEKENRIIIRNGQIAKGNPGFLSGYGEPEIVAYHIDHEVKKPHSGHLILYGKHWPTPDGAGFTVDFEEHFWKGTHGGVGGHQGVPFVAFAGKNALDTRKIMGSWDLHYQFYKNLTERAEGAEGA